MAKAGVTRTAVPALEKARNGGRATGRARARLPPTARAGVGHGPERRETPNQHQQVLQDAATRKYIVILRLLSRRSTNLLRRELAEYLVRPEAETPTRGTTCDTKIKITKYGVGDIAVQTRLAAPRPEPL